MNIPKQLNQKKFKFIKIRSGTKRPFESDWATKNNYNLTDSEFKEYLTSASVCGICTGYGNLVVIDCDTQEAVEAVEAKLPTTFTVKTGSGGKHFYYICKDITNRIVLQTEERHWGEVQAKGQQVIVPGSVHPNGNSYIVEHDTDIVEVDKKTIVQALGKFIMKKPKLARKSVSKDIEFDISTLLNKIPGLDNHDGEWQGAHPVHGSEGGQNFCINAEKNVWHCFRHNTGGDAFSLVAVLEGLVKCEECVPGLFTHNKELFKKVVEIAERKYGYENKVKSHFVELFRDDKNKSLNVEGIVEYIQEKCTYIVVRDETGRKPHIYFYEDGYYRMDGELRLINFIYELFNDVGVKSHYKNEIMDYIVNTNTVYRDELEINPRFINFENGVLDIETQDLLPHSEDYYFLYKIPHNYNPKSKCPKILEYFNSTLSEEYVTLSQELFGYCLYNDYPYAAIFYLAGGGGNGKGVWIHLLHTMLGRKNVVTKNIHSLMSNRFTTALLYGKLANIAGEIAPSALKNSDVLKGISSGDYVQAEYKGKDGFDFRNRAKIISACNEVPPAEDYTDGWYQRQYIIPFLKQFRDSPAEEIGLKDTLIQSEEELEGLIAWAIQGLVRLLKNHRFSYNVDKEERYMLFCENPERFFVDCTTDGGFEDTVLVNSLYKKYLAWCKKNTIPPVSQRKLAAYLTYNKKPLERIEISKGNYQWIRRYIKVI